jgi:hypothetical protein
VNKKKQKNFVNLGYGRCGRRSPWPGVSFAQQLCRKAESYGHFIWLRCLLARRLPFHYCDMAQNEVFF